MYRLHLVRQPANECINGEAGETRDAHAHGAQAGEFGQEPAHEFPRAHAQIESAEARTGAQELHDCTEEGEVIVVPDECEAEGLEVRQEHVRRRACHAGACTLAAGAWVGV